MFEGALVWLRAARREDLPRLCAFNNDVAVELAGGGDPPYPQSLERLQALFDADLGRGGRDGTAWAIETLEGVLIGQCALFDFQEVHRTCELGITIGDSAYWGKGYGRDAVELLVAFAFRYRNVRRVYLTTHAANERAYRCYVACGFVEEGRLREHVWHDGGYVDLIQMGLLRAEWDQRVSARAGRTG